MPKPHPAVEALLSYKINGMLPFDVTAYDLSITSLECAHALALMLGSAFVDSEETATTNPEIIRRAFDGIAKLIALAAFAGGDA